MNLPGRSIQDWVEEFHGGQDIKVLSHFTGAVFENLWSITHSGLVVESIHQQIARDDPRHVDL